jgi:hypothetical protein
VPVLDVLGLSFQKLSHSLHPDLLSFIGVGGNIESHLALVEVLIEGCRSLNLRILAVEFQSLVRDWSEAGLIRVESFLPHYYDGFDIITLRGSSIRLR